MSDDCIDNDKFCIERCSIAKVSKDLDSILVGPVVQYEAQKEDVGGFMEPRLWFEESLTVKFDLILLYSDW